MDRGIAGSAGGRATVERHGKEHMAAIGRKGFESFTQRYFQGDRQQATEWLRARAHAQQIESFADRELQRRLDNGAKVASIELPVTDDPDLDFLPF